MSRKCAYCASVLSQGQDTCPNCGAKYEAKKSSPPGRRLEDTQPPKNSLGVQTRAMGWNGALVNFGLFLYAAVLAFRGVTYALGKAYIGMELAQDVYTVAPMLKPADLIYGSVLFGGALFALKVRERLKDFRRNGPILLHLLLICVMAASVGYLLGSRNAVVGTVLEGVYPVSSGMAWELAITGIVLVCDVVYYRKRKDLFVL